MPKEDPETTALKKELTDLIAKVKVSYKFLRVRILRLNHVSKNDTY